jgi:hypothetical protein
MARRRPARHARPAGRGARAAAISALEGDVARLRSAGYSDQLELIRLSAVVDALAVQVTRLTVELGGLRREVHTVRTAPTQPDPSAEMLAGQVIELRATVATQQAMLSDLTWRMIDLLGHLEATAAAAPGAGAAASETSPAADSPGPSAYPAALTPAPQAPPGQPSPAPPLPTPPHVDRSGPPATPAATAALPGQLAATDESLDDETVLRLRLIRESFGR